VSYGWQARPKVVRRASFAVDRGGLLSAYGEREGEASLRLLPART